MTSRRPGGDAGPSLYNLLVQDSSSLDPIRDKAVLIKTNMVKITFQPVSAQKPEKDVEGDKINIPQDKVSLSALLLLLLLQSVLFGRFLFTRCCKMGCIVCTRVIT